MKSSKKLLLFKISSSINFDSNRGNVFNKKWSKILSHRKHFAAEWHLEVLMKTNNFHWNAGFCIRPFSPSKISQLSSFDISVNNDIVSIIMIIIFPLLYTNAMMRFFIKKNVNLNQKACQLGGWGGGAVEQFMQFKKEYSFSRGLSKDLPWAVRNPPQIRGTQIRI